MNVYRHLNKYDGMPAAVTVGVFDGLHLGHVALLKELIANAKTEGLLSVVVTFEPHPRLVLSKGNDKIGMLTTPEERIELIKAAGVDRVIVLPFTREFSDLTAHQFISEWLRKKIGTQLLLMGYNHHFGSDTLAPEEYIKVAQAEGIKAIRSTVFTLANGSKVSSSEVRKALDNGNVAYAADLLGRQYTISGKIVHGDAIGRTIGVRTANVMPSDSMKLIPADGVYAGTALIGEGKEFPAVINVGTRPTVGGNDRRIEVHLMNFHEDVYDKPIRVSFTARLRDEQRFEEIEDLRHQIEKDTEDAKKILATDDRITN